MAARGQGQGQWTPQSSHGGEGKLHKSSILVNIYLGCDFFAPIHKYTNTQKMVFLLCKGFYLSNRLFCICFSKKVISLDQYTDTHTKSCDYLPRHSWPLLQDFPFSLWGKNSLRLKLQHRASLLTRGN
jgi:hypothetical protein